MANRLVLHIGTEKTGSTAIQRFLCANRESLSKQGFAVPESLGAIEHRRFPLFFYPPEQRDDLTAIEALDSSTDTNRATKIAGWQQDFDQELAHHPHQTWLISSEHIHSRILRSNTSMSQLQAFIKARFHNTLIIVYLREPLSAALSLWSTAVLNGAAEADLPMPDNPYWHHLCCHRRTAEQLASWFPGQFQLRLFTPEAWRDADIIRDFSAAIGFALPADYRAAPQRVNASLSWLSLSLIARLNRLAQLNHLERPERDLVRAIRNSFDHLSPPAARASQKRAYAQAYAASNEWVRQRYFPSRSSLFQS
jgi:hypothetical protein